MDITLELSELQRKIDDLANGGNWYILEQVTKKAEIDTRAFIARTHPKLNFGGAMDGDYIQIGKSKDARLAQSMNGMRLRTTIYASYIARWWDTGFYKPTIIHTKLHGKREVYIRHKKVPPKGDYFENNRTAIEDYYVSRLKYYMGEALKEWQMQR